MPELKLIESLADIKPKQWNELAGENPFLRHEFLSALHDTGCACGETGWEPLYLTLWRKQSLAGAMPLYSKSHSRGEYVFDHAWADAFERYGLEYYPKLLCAAPFTPVTGPRLLARFPEDRLLLAAGAVELARQSGVSSLHVLFPSQPDLEALRKLGFMLREGIQFHWQNPGYASFEDFLAALNHDKRKKIRQERRRLTEAGIDFICLNGHEIGDDQLRFFYRCYLNTYHNHWSSPYLSLEFFHRLREAMAENLLLILAMRDGQPLACAFNVLAEDALFGRYWGATEFISSLHFETCYSQSIEYCIRHGISRFEGGAQGIHKMSRGLLPTPTWSAHWIADSRFADAIRHFLQEETLGIEHSLEELDSHTPFKKT
ncbi:MAG: GNAT family N-acetyltransferase [Methylococcaceae bacterium]|nr:GNAT family N-acetyltransferase [Methylococcaceae bacterium]